MSANINISSFREIEKPMSESNNLRYSLMLYCQSRNMAFRRFKCFTDSEHKDLLIQLSSDDRTSLDMFDLAIESLKNDYDFEFCYLNLSTHKKDATPNYKNCIAFFSNIEYKHKES